MTLADKEQTKAKTQFWTASGPLRKKPAYKDLKG